MFEDNASLKKIIISSPIKAIGNNSFKCCRSLEEVSLNSVIHIGSKAFKDCKSLNGSFLLKLSTLKSIAIKAFCNCSSFEKIVIPSSVISIRSRTIANCSSLSEVKFESPIKFIGFRIFLYCDSLISISVPHSMNVGSLGYKLRDIIHYQ